MKVEIEKYFADKTDAMSYKGLNNDYHAVYVKQGYTYYIFRTKEKAWIRHSGKLTKEEKQWVIQNENKV